ncbi:MULTISPECIES: ANTAR domain-containing protein [unclassified Streptomyces]|uniref:ANTAR domain-containing protein n=1 Tax=unclassified Streptomyces TaxID=2593676 RepID=UPI0033C39693
MPSEGAGQRGAGRRRAQVSVETDDGSRQAAASRAAVERAANVIVGVGRCTAAEARDILRRISLATDIKPFHVAQLVVEWGRTGSLCADVRHELERQLLRHTGAREAI